MPIEIKMPALSPTMEEGTLAKWLVKEGDTVKSGDIMAEIETDKATMEFEAVDEGTVAKILVAEGTDGVKVGIGVDGAAGDFETQCAQAFANVGAALAAAGAGWSHVIQTMTFLSRREDRARLREWRIAEYERLFPDGRYPPNTLLVVDALATDELLIEVQAIAAI